jgi:hypothetical protein
MTPDDFAQVAAHQAWYQDRQGGPPPANSAAPAPDHISDVINPAYTPEVYALYDAGDDPEDEDGTFHD